MASPSITSLPEKTINTYLSKWNASSLPIQYVITNDKFPVGATVTNYYTEVMVYVGGSLIGTIKQIPDSNNETKIDVRKYVQSTMFLNKGGTGQVDDNAWKEIYITGSENYVDSSGVTQSNAITGGGSGVIHYGVLSALQFGNANGGNMYDYVLDTNKLDLAKWMQVFERGKIVDYNNLTLSIIVDEDSEEFNLEVNQYDINDNLLDVSVITTNPEGGGVYRFSLDEQDINYDTFTTYITIQGVVNDIYGANLTELYYIDVDLGCSTAPGTPIELALSNITDSSIELNWVDKAYRETSYVVQRSLTGTGGWTKIATIPKNSQTYTDSGLTSSTTYYYRIKANQTDGVSSGYSNIANTTTLFQLADFTFSQSISISTYSSSPVDLYFKADGLTVFVLRNTGSLAEYSLSVAWDISTIVYVRSFSTGGVSGITFKSDGTKFYVISSGGTNVAKIREFDLTAWDISTSVLNQSFDVNITPDFFTQPNGIYMREDGLKIYITGNSQEKVQEWDLGTPYDISTMTANQSFSTTAEETQPQAIFFNDEGTILYIIGTQNDSVYSYDLSSAWDISTESTGETLSVTAQDTLPVGLFFKFNNPAKMYHVGLTNNKIYEYDA